MTQGERLERALERAARRSDVAVAQKVRRSPSLPCAFSSAHLFEAFRGPTACANVFALQQQARSRLPPSAAPFFRGE